MISRPTYLVFASVVVAGAMVWSLFFSTTANNFQQSQVLKNSRESTPLTVYCAASNRAVMQSIASEYEKEFSTPIEFQFGPSQTLLSSIEVSQSGDLYLPADSSYLEIAGERGLLAEVVPLARMQVVVGVPQGNPLGIDVFDDLLREDVRLVQANPEVAAVGKLTRNALMKQGRWESLQDRTAAFVSTVTEVANSVKVGSADAGIVYDAVLTTYPDVIALRIPEFEDVYANIEIGQTKFCKQPERARHFLRYLSASDRGLKHYRQFGFTPVDGETWAEAQRP